MPKEYSAATKAHALARLSQGESPAKLAADLGIHDTTIRTWQKVAKDHPTDSPEWAEIQRKAAIASAELFDQFKYSLTMEITDILREQEAGKRLSDTKLKLVASVFKELAERLDKAGRVTSVTNVDARSVSVTNLPLAELEALITQMEEKGYTDERGGYQLPAAARSG
jgi:predicted transcriptional regulator